MNQPLVSIVVPVYNVENYLDRCITSIVSQTYPHLQIILVDDGGTDRCPEMCDSWTERDARIRVIHKQNEGLGFARNSGMREASGEYIFFFDSDDYVHPEIVEKCVKCAESNRSDVVLYGFFSVYPDGKEIRRSLLIQKEFYQGEEIQSDLLPKLFTYEMGFGISAWGKMFRLQTLTQHNLQFVSERTNISEDAYFALEFFAQASAVSIVPENLYYYFERNNSLSRVYREDRQEKNDLFLNDCLILAERLSLPEQVSSHLKCRYHSYSIAAMKQLIASELESAQKRERLREIFEDPVLHKTLTWDVLRLENTFKKLFFILIKFRINWPCSLLLKIRTKIT